ncbi:TIGR03083 family protein [Hymenobacter gelipurpurascens]|uniref:TIGR03083 family protein n=1 Tax=Hymenobacter gelipurpurascens TaxID=89968 RepID=A0A212TBK1_9BACT|nr:maleylpyruvate isomerase N-terminal domain-containing protein [Hymenobacter gelipurpurascens]SNC63184.1 TIGR03083 family protein [Hymenobacter gelipurpurascens]
MQPLPQLHTAHLLPVLDQHLQQVISSLREPEWELPTVAPRWSVRDVALHLLDGNLRTLSMLRDGHFADSGPASPAYPDVVQYLNALNADWVAVGQRLSPAVITWLLEVSGVAYCNYMASLEPQAPAVFSVAWAGEEQSLNWFHVDREYTEKWHHQQQLRLAVGQEAPLLTRELYHPFLATCVRALPHHYRHTEAPAGTTLRFHVNGPAGDTWYLRRVAEAWELGQAYTGPVETSVELAGNAAWRLFMKSLPAHEAAEHLHVEGSPDLAQPLYSVTAVMA